MNRWKVPILILQKTQKRSNNNCETQSSQDEEYQKVYTIATEFTAQQIITKRATFEIAYKKSKGQE